MRRQAEAEEQARRAEQRRREAEALRKLQERNKAPWAQTPRALAPATHTASLAEIQRLEREKKAVNDSHLLRASTRIYVFFYLAGGAAVAAIDAATIGSAAKGGGGGAGGFGDGLLETAAI